MAGPAISVPYICPRCTHLLRSQQLAARHTLLYARSRRLNHIDSSPVDSESTNNRPSGKRFSHTDTLARAATLKSTSLGASTSILILNDSGRKRGKHGDAIGLEEVVPNEHNAGRILEIIEKTAKLPGQDEVNKSIEALRPDDLPTYGDRLFIPRTHFEHIAASLMEQFNVGQLSRYVTIKQAAHLVDVQKQTAPSSYSVGRSEWKVTGSNSHQTKHTLAPSKLTGKKAVVDVLLRTVWQLDIEEETMAEGVLELYPSEGILQLLTLQGHGRSSKLSRISQRYQVRVEVSSGVVEIYGREPACMKASHDITLAAVDAAEVQFRLDPFCDDTFGRILSDTRSLNRVASRCGAVLRHAAAGKEIIIVAESLAQAQRCKKMLLRHLLEGNAPQAVMVHSSGGGNSYANLVEAVSSSSDTDGIWHSASAVNLARGDTPVLLKPKFPILSDEALSTVMSNFRSGHRLQSGTEEDSSSSKAGHITSAKPDWATNSTLMYDVQMGQISFGGIGRLNQPLNPCFEAIVPGLSQFFLAEFKDCIPSSKTSLSIDWVASPWDNNHLATGVLEQLPQLRMTLLPNINTRGFEMESLVVVEAAPRNIYLPVPDAGIDMKITQREQIEVLNPLQNAGLASLFDSFNKQARLNGFEKAQLHDTVMFPLPNALLPSAAIDQSEGEDSRTGSREVVFTALPSLLTQKVCVPYEDLSLEYQSVYSGESASSYSLSLKMSVESSMPSAEAEVAQRKLLTAADKLACQLSGAIGPFKISPSITREFEGRPHSTTNAF